MRRSNTVKIREILRLSEIENMSNNSIGSCVGCSHNTVKELLEKTAKAGINYNKAAQMSDDELKAVVYPDPINAALPRPEPDMTYIDRELKKRSVSLMLLWTEYKTAYPDGLQYTQFCERYRDYIGKRKITMHIERKAGEKLYTDWAGDVMYLTDKTTGDQTPAYLFVSSMGYSGMPYAEAFTSKCKQSYITAHVNALKYYGALPLLIVPDNDKSAVTKVSRYDPEINRTYYEMAEHYGVAILPARPAKPRDKAIVETSVGIIETWIMAALRNEVFFSLGEINTAIKEKLNVLCDKPFQKREGSRRSEYLKYDLPSMRILPREHYEYANWVDATVNTDYHAEAEKNWYSVPYTYAHQIVSVRLTSKTAEVFHNNVRIASHLRIAAGARKYATEKEHMPPEHVAYLGMTKETMLQWAAEVGENTTEMVKHIFERVKVEEQGYRSCMGLKRVYKTYGKERFEKACGTALTVSGYGSSYVERILKSGADKKPKEKVVLHGNIRGKEYYAGLGVKTNAELPDNRQTSAAPIVHDVGNIPKA
jgi:transposase